jgi:hypothetical protein
LKEEIELARRYTEAEWEEGSNVKPPDAAGET